MRVRKHATSRQDVLHVRWARRLDELPRSRALRMGRMAPAGRARRDLRRGRRLGGDYMPTREEATASQEPMAYFSHDSNAFDDDKCKRLIRRRGWDGYGRWWRLCEYMAAQKGHRIAFETEEDVSILAGVLGFGQTGAFDEYVAIEDCKSFVACLLDIGLLERDEDGRLLSMPPYLLVSQPYKQGSFSCFFSLRSCFVRLIRAQEKRLSTGFQQSFQQWHEMGVTA